MFNSMWYRRRSAFGATGGPHHRGSCSVLQTREGKERVHDDSAGIDGKEKESECVVPTADRNCSVVQMLAMVAHDK